MKQMLDYIKEHNLVKSGDKIVVAFSGGPDSVYLLLGLLKIRKKMKLSLAAVHINHKLQDIAEQHVNFVRQFCKEHNIDLYYYEKDIRQYAQNHKLSLEEAGRKFRYQKFYEVKEKLAFDRIAVAHHMDDRAETVLYRMARGTGWKGMAGIRPDQQSIIRPMLSISKKEILEELNKLGQEYNIDPSNRDTFYARNRIRHNVIPQLECINTKAIRHICDLAEQMNEMEDYLKEQISMDFRQCVEKKENSCLLCLPLFLKYPIFMQKEILKKAVVETAGKEKDLTRRHIQDIFKLMHAQTGKKLDLPYQIEVLKEYEFLILRKKIKKEETEIILSGEGSYRIPFAKGILNVKIYQKNQDISEKIYTKTFDYDKIKHVISVRTCRQDDYFIMNRQGQHKKLNRYFIDQKIPSHQRKNIPVIADGSHILWIIGGRISEAYKTTKETKSILQLSWEPMEET